MTVSTMFDPLALVEFGDAAAVRPATPPLSPSVAALAAYLNGGADGGVLGTPAKAAAWIERLAAGLGDVEVTIAERGVIALRVGDDAWPVLLFRASAVAAQVCRVCGCTAELRCHGGCRFSTPNLCSKCVAAQALDAAGA